MISRDVPPGGLPQSTPDAAKVPLPEPTELLFTLEREPPPSSVLDVERACPSRTGSADEVERSRMQQMRSRRRLREQPPGR